MGMGAGVDRVAWHALPVERVARLLGTGPHGLTSEEARRGLEERGPNRLEAERAPGIGTLVVKQLRSPLIYLLFAAAVISLLAMHPIDAAVIAAVVSLNTVIGVLQEWRAERALEALRKLASPHARVVRDGDPRVVLAEEVVPGDVLVLETGDRLPADARVVEGIDLQADESSLTGESEPITKVADEVAENAGLGDRRSMLWTSTPVVNGRGTAYVVETGMSTVMGRIAGEVQTAGRQQTPLQRRLASLGTAIGVAAVVMAGSIFVLGLLRGFDVFEMVLFAVAAAVSAIPEGLPAVISVVLALGVQRMAANNAVVRRLPAVETLGSATVVCSDKTGTITRNEMTVRRMWAGGMEFDVSGEGFDPEGAVTVAGGGPGETRRLDEAPALRRLVEIGVYANNATLERTDEGWRVEGTPTEGALLVAARKAGMHDEALEKWEGRLDEVPFSSAAKYMATLERVRVHDSPQLLVKGAPERILAFSTHILIDGKPQPMTAERREAVEAANRDLARQALRVVAGAYREMSPGTDEVRREQAEEDLVLAGLWGLLDPPRPEAIEAVSAAHRAGIRVVMITGDHAETATAIAERVGIAGHGEQTVSGSELDAMPQDELRRRVGGIAVYARVSPAHKLRIVEALQDEGEVVAMTGDGVNDGPALKRANIGVAMGVTGTEVAKEAADMVLSDDDFATIIRAVEEGRVIFGNLRRVVSYLVTTNLGEVMTLTAALVLGFHLPLTAVMILWVNLVTDGLCTIPLGLEPKHEDVLDRPPRPVGEGVLTRRSLGRVVLLAAVIASGTLGLFAFDMQSQDMTHARSVAFTALVAFEWFRAFSSRSQTTSIFRLPLFGNRWLLLGIGVAVLLQLGALYTPLMRAAFQTVPLSAADWLVLLPVAASVLVLDELLKLGGRRLVSRRSAAAP